MYNFVHVHDYMYINTINATCTVHVYNIYMYMYHLNDLMYIPVALHLLEILALQ